MGHAPSPFAGRRRDASDGSAPGAGLATTGCRRRPRVKALRPLEIPVAPQQRRTGRTTLLTAHLASPTVPAARRVTGRFTPSAAPTGPPPATPGRIDPPLPGARPGSDFAELSRRVKAAGLMARRPGYYAVKITLTAALLV